jgi:glutamine synthetase
VNTVLNTITAEKFGEFADKIDAGADPVDVAKEALNKHWRVIFNGDNYDEEMQQMLTDRGVWRIDSGVEAIHTLSSEKNINLFEKTNVMSKEECEAREIVLHDHYSGTVEMEALTLIDMINQHIIPAVKASGVGPLEALEASVPQLQDAVATIHAAENSYEAAKIARVLRLETLIDIREVCDAAEGVVPANMWTLATYKELMFLDSHVGPGLEEIYE